MQRIPQTATLTPFRTPVRGISYFVNFGFNQEENEKKASTICFIEIAFCKKKVVSPA